MQGSQHVRGEGLASTCKGNGWGRGATGMGWGTSATMREEVELGEELAQGMHDDFELGCVRSNLGQER